MVISIYLTIILGILKLGGVISPDWLVILFPVIAYWAMNCWLEEGAKRG